MARRGAYRTVRESEVRIHGRTYRCKGPLMGELDGKRCYFMRYADTDPPLACLWGTEAYAKAVAASPDMPHDEAADEDEQILAPDGYLRWYWWEAKEVLNG